MYVAAGCSSPEWSLAMANVASQHRARSVSPALEAHAIEEAQVIERYGEAYRHYMPTHGALLAASEDLVTTLSRSSRTT